MRSGVFHFRMSRQACIRLAQMLFEDKRSKHYPENMAIEELEDLFGGKVKAVIDGELQWENWGRMIRVD